MMMKTSRCLELGESSWIDRFVEIVRNPYAEEDEYGDIVSAELIRHATKREIAWAIVKLLSCLAVFVFCTLSARVASAEMSWKFALMVSAMFASFLLHCLAAFKLDDSDRGGEKKDGE